MKNYIKSLLRSALNNPLFTVINLTGLTISIVSVVVISLWVDNELGYDSFHQKRERIYKISQGKNFSIVPPLFHAVKEEFPEIESIIRTSSDAEAYINADGANNPVKVNNILYSSPGFNHIFTIQNKNGDFESGLNEPNSIILSEKAAQRIFGETKAEGQLIHYRSSFPVRELTLTVKSVVTDFPSNTTLKFDAIIPFSALDGLMPNGMVPDDNWRDGYCNMYVLLKEGTDVDQFENKLVEFGTGLDNFVYGIDPEGQQAKERKLGLVGLSKLYFYNNNRNQIVRYISIIGLLILLIALINYINLSVAKLFSTYQSIYIRKINGASRFQLVKIILTESIIYSLIAFLLSLILIEICKPMLNSLVDINLDFGLFNNRILLLILFCAALLIGFIAGLYPAFKLTSDTPMNKTQPDFVKKDRNFIRQALVVFQFAVSIVLIVSIIVISKQLDYLSKKELGFDSEHVLFTKLNKNLYGTYNTFKNELLKNPEVKSISGSQNELGQVCVTLTREINGKDRYFQELPVDPDFIETMGLKIIKGRNFSYDMQTDPYQTVILNETAVKKFELNDDEILGTEVFMYDRKAKVIGVVKDFYFQSFHHQLDPFMLFYHPGSIGTANIKISSGNISETIGSITKVWNEFSPDIPFEYNFLDKTYEALYKQERQFSKIVFSFLLVAIIIAGMGLFGLVSFTTLQRTKEIGVRKVNGARISEVMAMLNKDIIKWVAIAFIIACPVAWFVIHKWLENFAYKTTLSWWIFALAGLLALSIALLTVSWQSWRAATRNPVEALRYE